MCDEAVIAEAVQTKGASRIREIARLLGKPEDTFFNLKHESHECSDAFELLQLWNGMKSAADRHKLLNFARTLAAGRK